MDNSEKLINKIREGNVRPLPRWRFIIKEALSWLIFSIAAAFGAVAFSVILFAMQQVDFNLLRHISHSGIELVLALMPVFWIVSLVIFLVAAIISIRNSRKGYKFTSPALLGICTALSILLGTLFFITGGGKWLENAFDTNISFYESINDRKVKLWSVPDEGFLSGTIVKVVGDSMILEDFSGKKWSIDIKNIDVVPSVKLESGEQIKIIGKMISGITFQAEKIRPWGGAERMKEHPQRK
jgi:hypothetical protein